MSAPEPSSDRSTDSGKGKMRVGLGRVLSVIPKPVRLDFRHVGIDMRRWLNRNRWRLLLSVALVLLTVTFVTMPRDEELLRFVRGDQSPEVRAISDFIGKIGDVAGYNLFTVVVIFLVAKWKKSPYLRRLAVTVIITTTLAGLICNLFRFGMGRTRPYATAHYPLKFHGPQPSAKKHGFPSGHTSTAFGTAIPILIACPQAGVPLTIFAGTVGWARMNSRSHYPSDVLVGGTIGVVFGLAGGLPLYRKRKRGEALYSK